MTPSLATRIGPIAAVAISIAVLLLAGGTFATATDAAISPFGYHHVLVVHALTSLLLSWSIAGLLVPARRSFGVRAAWIVGGGVIALFTIALGRQIGVELDLAEIGYLGRMPVRVLWCVALQLPWCVLARMLEPIGPERTAGSVANRFALALVVALVIPYGYVNTLTEKQTEIAKDLWQKQRMVKALHVVERLCALGSPRGFGVRQTPDGGRQAVSAQSARETLRQAIDYYDKEIRSLRAGPLTDPQRIKLAERLSSLGRLDEAQAVLEPIASRHLRAAVTLAQTHQEQFQLAEGSRWYEKAIRLARSTPSANPNEAALLLEIQKKAYNALADNACELRQFERAEGYYFEAIDRLPSHRAYFHHQLGRYYKETGAPIRSAEHLSKAHDLAPKEYGPGDGALVGVLSTGTPVGIFAPSASNRDEADRAGTP